ncbi:aminodeoxychorismate synthase component I [Marinobacterium sediminicola]|uniref:aminodeoxychorismate synthase n=1 Tax=Marinobacterium sediminicola TaxID=518898 RepID=A0ABY1RX93_9GAMM|nr:aminodeoxychorismate synthase component I [Marinobacterium sediminicola]ULG67830.1 aminodeoxychorismate synthase component I [Marinobacterium sediminicola]SMR71490.1 para-aminobenzoate synthetase component 1 [Marinobacterium sediminicola]
MIQQQYIENRLSAHELLERIRPLGHAILLDSSQPTSVSGRFDIISAAPDRLIRFTQKGLSVVDGDQKPLDADTLLPFDYLDQCLAELGTIQPNDETPFCGGLIGIFGYDLGRALETLPEQAEADIDFPWLLVGRYLWAIVIDHQLGTCRLVSHPMTDPALLAEVTYLISATQLASTEAFQLVSPFNSNLSASDYRDALQRINDYIHAGDCYQINFAQRFKATYQGDPWHAYKALRQVAPTPFAAFMDMPEGAILSLSPERFLLSEADGRVETRPIKGTRPRGNTPERDKQLAQELSDSAKDRAENLMIVDLLRNDLSRSCKPGSIEVPALFSIEHYPNVHHMVSVVCGQLKESTSPLELLRDAFPGGSITGAPKIRAMEIIDELEPQRRSIYCGSIGYISCCGRMDTSITIRTLLCQNDSIYCWAGGGIVADSNIEEEYQETFNKVNNLINCLQGLSKAQP